MQGLTLSGNKVAVFGERDDVAGAAIRKCVGSAATDCKVCAASHEQRLCRQGTGRRG